MFHLVIFIIYIHTYRYRFRSIPIFWIFPSHILYNTGWRENYHVEYVVFRSCYICRDITTTKPHANSAPRLTKYFLFICKIYANYVQVLPKAIYYFYFLCNFFYSSKTHIYIPLLFYFIFSSKIVFVGTMLYE